MYTFEKVARLVGGEIKQMQWPGGEIATLLVDSRQLQDPAVTIFFALPGARQDGHIFINDLYGKGVRNFVVSHGFDQRAFAKANFLGVSNVLSSLQTLAGYHRSQHRIPVVGITGSNGKTIVKEWLFQLLNIDFHIVKSPRSYNSQIGVPLSVWQLDDASDLAIFEAGISTRGEMTKLQQVIRPTLGIFTNIGSAHAEGFSTMEEKLTEKLLLFKESDLVICSRDHELIYQALLDAGIPVFCWSVQGNKADLTIVVTKSDLETTIEYRQADNQYKLSIPFTDDASIENAIHCLAFIKANKLEVVQLARRFESLLPIAMRLEALEGINDCLIINDVYNADYESLNVAMSFATFQAHQLKKTLILTDLLQQSPDDTLYVKVAGLIRRYGFTRLLAVGDRISDLAGHLGEEIESHFFKTTADLIEAFRHLHFFQELVLVKGARVFGLEQVTAKLSLKTHQTVLEINLAALARNLKTFEEYLVDRNTKIMAMVKAAAYGSGSIEIARFLQSRNIDYLAVAYVDEGIELRKAGIETPIMVLNIDLHNLGLIAAYHLEPEVFSPNQLQTIADYAEYHNVVMPVHLKVETGMHRLGLLEEELADISEILAKTPRVVVKSVFSHLAASDDPNQDHFTQEQLAHFKHCADQLCRSLAPTPLLHIANSQAIVRFPEAQFSMVRLGIGMYGIGMPEEVKLECVHTLKTHVSQIKLLQAGDTVGYGRKGIVDRPQKVAIVAIGYADGLIRKAGNGRYALIVNERKAPIVGSICMDMTMIDVTNIPDVSVGSEVIVFGKDLAITDLANAADTIPYEVFTNLSSRVKRIYTYD